MAISMGVIRYEPLKCDNCGKTLGRMRIDVKVFPPKFWMRLVTGGPLIRIEKDVLCNDCFRQVQRINEKTSQTSE